MLLFSLAFSCLKMLFKNAHFEPFMMLECIFVEDTSQYLEPFFVVVKDSRRPVYSILYFELCNLYILIYLYIFFCFNLMNTLRPKPRSSY